MSESEDRITYDPYAPSVVMRHVPKPDEVPSLTEGSIKEIMEAIGDDKEKAKAALNEEQAKEKPRKSLVEHLSDIVKSDK